MRDKHRPLCCQGCGEQFKLQEDLERVRALCANRWVCALCFFLFG